MDISFLVQENVPAENPREGLRALWTVEYDGERRCVLEPQIVRFDDVPHPFAMSDRPLVALAHDMELHIGTQSGAIHTFDLRSGEMTTRRRWEEGELYSRMIQEGNEMVRYEPDPSYRATDFIGMAFGVHSLAAYDDRIFDASLKGVHDDAGARIYPHITGQLAVMEGRLLGSPVRKADDGATHQWDEDFEHHRKNAIDLYSGLVFAKNAQPRDGSGGRAGRFEFTRDGRRMYVAHGNWPCMRTSRSDAPFNTYDAFVATAGSHGFAEHGGIMYDLRDMEVEDGNRVPMVMDSEWYSLEGAVLRAAPGERLTSMIESEKGLAVTLYDSEKNLTTIGILAPPKPLRRVFAEQGRFTLMTSWNDAGDSPRLYANGQ